MSDDKKPWDIKQIGAGAGGSIIALFLLQDRGLEMVNQKNQASNQVVIEKTIANSHRIENLEGQMKDLNAKIDGSFKDLRRFMKEDVETIRRLIQEKEQASYNKTDHQNYADTVSAKFKVLEEKIELLNERIRGKNGYLER